MGADLIINYIIQKGKTPLKTRQKKMLKAVKQIKNKYFEGLIEEFNNNGKDFKTFEDVKTHYIKTINDFFNCLNYRDVTTIVHKGEILILSGGMSWGDSPTESFNTISDLSDLDNSILKAGEFI